MAPALKELILMRMEDIGHFEPISCHAVPVASASSWEDLDRQIAAPRRMTTRMENRGGQ
jgi:hypothetical protein